MKIKEINGKKYKVLTFEECEIGKCYILVYDRHECYLDNNLDVNTILFAQYIRRKDSEQVMYDITHGCTFSARIHYRTEQFVELKKTNNYEILEYKEDIRGEQMNLMNLDKKVCNTRTNTHYTKPIVVRQNITKDEAKALIVEARRYKNGNEVDCYQCVEHMLYRLYTLKNVPDHLENDELLQYAREHIPDSLHF